MSNREIKDFFSNLSKDEGFDEIGFAQVALLTDEYAKFEEWVDRGYHADMNYLSRKQGKRKNITLLLKNAKSVIVFLQNYNTDFHHSQEPEMGKISRYAWGDDYHKIIKKKLLSISQKAEQVYPGNSFKIYVDTGPVLEKQWAVKAGVGWQGKNSLILNRKLGSYCFIGIIITDLVIEQDEKAKNYCGSCTACIDNCPTSAIVQPAVVDSNKCISYWTIESDRETSFPKEINNNLNGWIFGCDICQEVCPWNSKKIATEFIPFMPRNGETELVRDEIMNMQEAEFALRFSNSNLKRSRLLGLKRNCKELMTRKD